MDHAQAIARSTNMRASVVLLLGLAGVACDPDAVTEMSVEQATRVVHETEKARAAQHAAFSKCMAGCVSTEASEATDRATCRLGCGSTNRVRRDRDGKNACSGNDAPFRSLHRELRRSKTHRRCDLQAELCADRDPS